MKRQVLDPKHQHHGALGGAAGFIALWLLLDRLGAAQWIYGVFWTLAALRLALNITALLTQQTRSPRWE